MRKLAYQWLIFARPLAHHGVVRHVLSVPVLLLAASAPAWGALPPTAPSGQASAVLPAAPGRDRFWPMIQAEARRAGIPPTLADAVAIVETGYTEDALGSSGEIGLMQVMPATAVQLGFRGSTGDLFQPATNIHYGVAYLARAWAASGGNACRALMKYRAGVGQEGYSPLSIQYCRRAGAWLRGTDAALATNVAANTPAAPNLADPYAMAADGRPWRRVDMTTLAELAGMPVQLETSAAASPPAGSSPSRAPRGWHIGAGAGGQPRIQAVMDMVRDDAAADDPHEIHVPPGGMAAPDP